MPEKIKPGFENQGPFGGEYDREKAMPATPNTSTQTFDESGDLQKDVAPLSKWSLLGEAAEQAFLEGEFMSAIEKIKNAEIRLQNNPKISAEEANKRFPGMPEPFTGEVDPAIAEIAYGHFKRRQAFEVWKSRAGELPVGFDLAAGVAGSVVDPLNLALGSVVGKGMTALGLKQGFAAVVSENILQSAASESLIRSRRADEQQPLSLEESAMNVVAGTLGGVGLHYGIQGAIHGARAAVIRLIKAKENGQRLPVEKALDPPTSNRAVSEADAGYSHVPVAHPSEREFFVSVSPNEGVPVSGLDSYGGLTAVDSPTHARLQAAGEDGVHGAVQRVVVDKDAKFLDLDAPVTDEVVSRVAKALGVDPEPGASLRDVLNQVKRGDVDKLPELMAALKSEGITGFKEVVNTPSGKANALHLYGDSGVSMSEPIPIDPNKVMPVSVAELEKLQAEQNLPENREYPPFTPEEQKAQKALVTVGGEKSGLEIESEHLRAEVAALAKENPVVKELADDAKFVETYADGLEKVGRTIVEKSYDSDNVLFAVREALTESGVPASADDIEAIADAVDLIKKKSVTKEQFFRDAEKFLNDDVIATAPLHKANALRNAASTMSMAKAALSLEGGRSSPAENLLDYILGTSKKFGFDMATSTKNLHEAQFGLFLQGLARRLGDNRELAMNGALRREIVLEIAEIQKGNHTSVTGSKQAFEIAKALNDQLEDQWSTASGYNSLLGRIDDYIFIQSHDRDLIVGAGKEAWLAEATTRLNVREADGSLRPFDAATDSGFFDQFKDGTYGTQIFSKNQSGFDISARLARKRTLVAKSPNDFYEYNLRFGVGGPVESVIAAADSAARTIAVISRLGNTPYANVDRVIRLLSKGNPEIAADFAKNEYKIRTALHNATFAYTLPTHGFLDRSLRAGHLVTTLAKNNLAFFSAFLDIAPAASMAAARNDSSLLVESSRYVAKLVSGLARGSKEASEVALKAGVYTGTAHNFLMMESGLGTGRGTGAKMLELQSIATGQRRMRNAATMGQTAIMSIDMGKYASTSWDDLAAPSKQFLLDHGIGENEHALLAYGLSTTNDGVVIFDQATMHQNLLEDFRSGKLNGAGIAPELLEEVPDVVKSEKSSAYIQKNSPYRAGADEVVFPRKDGYGKDISGAPAYSPESASKVATQAYEIFKQAGHSHADAGAAATLHSTFFDSLGKMTGKDPEALFSAYKLVANKKTGKGSTAGSFSYESKAGRAIISTRKGAAMDKTVIHESAHFFLEALSDVRKAITPEAPPERAKAFRILEGPDGFMGIANKLSSLPKLESSIKGGKKITLSAEMKAVPSKGVTGRTLDVRHPAVVARDGSGKELGFLAITGEHIDGKDVFTPAMVEVSPEHRRIGVASSMYKYANAFMAKLHPSQTRTELGELFGKSIDYDKLDASSKRMLSKAFPSRASFDVSPEFKAELDGIYEWLNVKGADVHTAAHERFANGFETFLRTAKAPKPELEGFFATVRDWYRRAFEMVRRGFANIPFSLHKAERAPEHVESFFNKLMGGAGPAELHGALTYKPESIAEDILYAPLGHDIRLPSKINDVVLRAGAAFQDMVDISTSAPGHRELSYAYGGPEQGPVMRALRRMFWHFKTSAMKSANTVGRVYNAQPGGGGVRVMKMAALSASLYVMQRAARDLWQGKTPENPATPMYIAKAIASSGAGTIWADSFVDATMNAKGAWDMKSRLAMAPIGPTGEMFADVGSVVGASIGSIFSDDIKFPTKETGRLLTDNLPYLQVNKTLTDYLFLAGLKSFFEDDFAFKLESNVNKRPGILDENQQYFMFKPSESPWLN